MKNTFLILHSAVAMMPPLLLAACGGLFTEISGMLNIALEGLLLAGSFSAVVAVYYTGSITAGLIFAIIISIALSAIFGFTVLKLHSNVFIAGLAVNLFSSGLSVMLSQYFFNTRGVVNLSVSLAGNRQLNDIRIPLIKDIPVLGQLFSGHNLYVYSSWILLVISWIVIYKTPFGYRMRACGKHSTALISLGINPDAYRWTAFLISGFFCGIGGSFLSLSLAAFIPNMTAGKGWIALVIIFLGGRRPIGLFAAALAYCLASSLSNYAQGVLTLPADLILAMPYLLTLLAMIAVSVFTKHKS